MSSCLVCLQTENCDQSFNIFDSNNEHYNAIYIIEKYLWFAPRNDNTICKTICFDCWNQLNSFHKFYNKIEEAHQNISEIKEHLDSLQEVKVDIIKIDYDDFVHENIQNIESLQFADCPESDNFVYNTEKNDNPVRDNCGTTTVKNDNNESDVTDEGSKSQLLSISNIKNGPNLLTIRPNKKGKKPINYNSEEIDERISSFMTLICDICSEKLPTFTNLKRHFRIEHTKNGYAVCCKRRYFKRCILLEHINSHINPEYFKCDQCQKIMSSKETLRKHIKTHNINNEERVQLECNFCNKKFADKVGLSRHEPIHIPQDQWTWKCTECDKLCPSKFLLQTHVNDNHRHKRICQICGQVVQTKRFKDHMTKHATIEETRVQCKTCDAWMKNKKYLQVHMAKHLDTNSTHMCTICGKLSPNSKALNIHIKYTHSEQKNHECSICHKTFKRPLVLKQHMAGHTGNPLYTCSYCPRTFIYDSHYHNHRKKAHRQQWEADKAANMKLRTNFLKIKNANNNKTDN